MISKSNIEPFGSLNKAHQLKVVLVGSMNVGKTSLSNRFLKNEFSNIYQATIGTNYSNRTMNVNGSKNENCDFSISSEHLNQKKDGESVNLQIWDTAGMEQYQSLGPIYFRDSDAAIFVFDVTNKNSSKEIEDWHHKFLSYVHDPFYGIVVASKSDLVHNGNGSEIQKTISEMKQWANVHDFAFITASAKTGENVNELFEKVAQGAFSLKQDKPTQFDFVPSGSKPKQNCC